MKAKIKGEWVEYDYAINCNHTIKDKIISALEKNLQCKVEYLGKSKAIEIDGVITLLKKRSLFFKYIKS